MTAAKRNAASRSAKTPLAKESPAARRVLVVSHSHPELTKGGAEIAAYNQYLAHAAAAPDTTWFLGCAREATGQHLGAVFSQPFGPNEYVYAAGAFDWFNFSNMDPAFPAAFRALLAELQPEEVHFHHYINIGVEALLHVKETLPNCRVTMTLHEYLAICHHYGQMVTKPALHLCHSSAPAKCAKCFPERPPEDFFLRKRYIERFFDLVDQFISPSRFLAQRYEAWGIAPERMLVRENIVNFPASLDASAGVKSSGLQQQGARNSGATLRVGYFGQISKLKGIGVLLDAAKILEKQDDFSIVFEIHGDDQGQPPEFQAEFRGRLAAVGANVLYLGPYERERVASLMQRVDVVLVPSIWWENSPLVIQEALQSGRAVVCSDIGGMKEKAVLENVHAFPVGSPIGLIEVLRHCGAAVRL